MPSPHPTIVKETEEMFLRLGFSQAVVLKLVEDQGIDSPWTLTSLSKEDIATICDMIHRSCGLVSGKTLDRGNQISVLAAKNLKPAAFMFKTMEHCSKNDTIQDVYSTSVLCYQHQWELEQKKSDDIEAPKVDKNNWTKTMEKIIIYLKLVRGMSGTPLTYVVQCHIKVAHIPPGSGAYLNFDEEVIARASIVDTRSNLRLKQDSLDRVYIEHQTDSFKVDNAVVYQRFSRMITDTDAYVYVKQRRGTQDD